MPKFENPFSGLKNNKKLTKEELIRAVRFSIASEYEAIQIYTQITESTDNKDAIKIMKSVSDEEAVHAGEFLALLYKLSPEEKNLYKKGEKETTKMEKSKLFLKVYDDVYIDLEKAAKKYKNPDRKYKFVMEEFGAGKLHSGSGAIVTDQKQAESIAGHVSGKYMKEDDADIRNDYDESGDDYMKISEKEGGNKSVPSKYEGISNFADETNKKYPLDEKHIHSAIAYFGKPKDYGKYKPEERKIIAKKIHSAAKKFGVEISDEWLKKFDIMQKAHKFIKLSEGRYIDLNKAEGQERANHKYIKRTKGANGKWIYSYGEGDEKDKQPEPEPNDKDKDKKPDEKSSRKGKIKIALKKIANIFAEALSGKDAVQPTGEAMESTGESLKDQKSSTKKPLTSEEEDIKKQAGKESNVSKEEHK
jgi:rubrerythrin